MYRDISIQLEGLGLGTCLSPLSERAFAIGMKNSSYRSESPTKCGASKFSRHQIGDSPGPPIPPPPLPNVLETRSGQGEGLREKARLEMWRAPGGGSSRAHLSLRGETTFGEMRNPQPRVTVHSSGHAPDLQESGSG